MLVTQLMGLEIYKASWLMAPFTRICQYAGPLAAERVGDSKVSPGIVAEQRGQMMQKHFVRTAAPFLVLDGAVAQATMATSATSAGGWLGRYVNSTRGLIFPTTAAKATNLADHMRSMLPLLVYRDLKRRILNKPAEPSIQKICNLTSDCAA